MRIAINLVLIALIGFLVYMLYSSIEEPIAFQKEKERRKEVVKLKLETLRTCQEMHRDITGYFSGNYDTLAKVLKEGQFRIIKVTGDPDDPTSPEIFYDTIYAPAIDSIQKLGINVDSLKYVPFTEGDTFFMEADTIIYQKTKVNVMEAGTTWKTFMGKFGTERYAKYDNNYKPGATFKFGDLSTPTLTGNWE